jgi:wyosine [tRNA(Phe)-imidazoG37] synthetase (radical SAM superfamily)
MKYVFGPVPSRRLGQSLGIDPIPLKTCNWNCVYCQLGRTTPLTNQRKEYTPRKKILSEVRQALAAHQPGEIDWVTIVGSGEPSLHAGLGWLIREVKQITDLPLAVITNGSLLYLADVRRALSQADAVLPSLDAGNTRLFRRINRPWPGLTFIRFVAGLATFRQEYTGKLWLEVMLVKGLNDTQEALEEIAAAIEKIKPDQVHLNQPTRPPSEAWVQPPDEEALMRAMAILGDVARVVHPAQGSFDLSGGENIQEGILGIITRHPMEEGELIASLEKYAPQEIKHTLNELEYSKKAQVVERFGKRFWGLSTARYSGSSS